MTQIRRVVTGGVDAHADNHHAVALDERGRLLGDAVFATTARGYRELLGWLEAFGQVRLVGIESTGAYAAGLVRFLSAHAVGGCRGTRPASQQPARRGPARRSPSGQLRLKRPRLTRLLLDRPLLRLLARHRILQRLDRVHPPRLPDLHPSNSSAER
jgi:hypothetical protein